MKKMGLVVLLALILFTGCQKQNYLTTALLSDRYVVLVVLPKNKAEISVIAITRSLVAQYIDSVEDISAIFGQKVDSYIVGTKEEWDYFATLLMQRENLTFQGIRPNLEATISLTLKEATYLRKLEGEAKLETLFFTNIKKLLKKLENKKYKVRIFDAGKFIEPNLEKEFLLKYLNSWTNSIIEGV